MCVCVSLDIVCEKILRTTGSLSESVTPVSTSPGDESRGSVTLRISVHLHMDRWFS